MCVCVCVCTCVYVCVVVASSTAVSDPAGARRLGHASIGLSVAGIIIAILVVIIVVVLVTTASSSSCAYTVDGTCYDSRRYVGYYGTCYSYELRSGTYCYY